MPLVCVFTAIICMSGKYFVILPIELDGFAVSRARRAHYISTGTYN
jgi:hypothetical protein